MLPFNLAGGQAFDLEPGDWIVLPGVRSLLASGAREIPAKAVTKNGVQAITLYLPPLTRDETEILLDGCLMNYYAAQRGKAEEHE
jgi:aconitate hydratase